VVDDDAPTSALIARHLKNDGYDVVALTSPNEAIARSETGEHFDIAVLDVVMPDTTGEVLAARLRRETPDLPVLYVTGFDDVLFASRSVLWSGESFLQKPFTLKGLSEAVSLALYGHLTHPHRALSA
jgi:two-component system cell cycle sensor histidine kinase/response regulator CckA